MLRGKKNVKVQFALRIGRLVKVVSKAYSYKVPISWNSVFWAFFFLKSHNNNFSSSHWPGNVLLFLFKSSKFVVVIKVGMKFKIYQEATGLSRDTRGLFYNHTKGRASFYPRPPPSPHFLALLPLSHFLHPSHLSPVTRFVTTTFVTSRSLPYYTHYSRPPPPLTLPPLPLPSHNLSLRPPRLAPYPSFLTMHLVSYLDLTRPSQATTKISVTRRIWVGDYLALYLTPSSSRTLYFFTSFRPPPSPLLQSPQLDHLCRVNYNSVLSSNYFVSGSSQPLFFCNKYFSTA